MDHLSLSKFQILNHFNQENFMSAYIFEEFFLYGKYAAFIIYNNSKFRVDYILFKGLKTLPV